jgi:hypothetical protein
MGRGIFLKMCCLCTVKTVGHVRLFTAGLRNLHNNVENRKKMTDWVAKWKLTRDASLSWVEA